MKADAILEEVKELPQTELRSLVLKLADVLDEESNGELASILETRKRAAEMTSGAVKGVSHDETFARARESLGGCLTRGGRNTFGVEFD
ncbi:MAG: hypothetical protein ACKVJX_13430 [Verrucomicrobiia bacterium]|jgi:predicted RecB family endonuclease